MQGRHGRRYNPYVSSILLVVAALGVGWFVWRRRRANKTPFHERQISATELLQSVRRHPDPTVRTIQEHLDSWADQIIQDRSVHLDFDESTPPDTAADILMSIAFTVKLKLQEAKEFEQYLRKELGELS